MKSKLKKKINKVYLVGAGPGNPEYLTVKALTLLTKYADVVVYDRLISKEIISLIPKKVKKIFAGKEAKLHHKTQDEINEILAEYALAGKKVVRLKGGDPFIFGRAAEEMEYLLERGIPVEVVPGISAAIGAASSIGIPLTHREMATGVRYVTGHVKDGEPVNLDWNGLADSHTTLVIYMGLGNINYITKKLIAEGMNKKTPAMIIYNATCADEKFAITELAKLPSVAKKFKAPVITIIGKVVSFTKTLKN